MKPNSLILHVEVEGVDEEFEQSAKFVLFKELLHRMERYDHLLDPDHLDDTGIQEEVALKMFEDEIMRPWSMAGKRGDLAGAVVATAEGMQEVYDYGDFPKGTQESSKRAASVYAVSKLSWLHSITREYAASMHGSSKSTVQKYWHEALKSSLEEQEGVGQDEAESLLMRAKGNA